MHRAISRVYEYKLCIERGFAFEAVVASMHSLLSVRVHRCICEKNKIILYTSIGANSRDARIDDEHGRVVRDT